MKVTAGAAEEFSSPAGFRVEAGRPLPRGAHPIAEGINFALLSRHATSVALLLYRSAADAQPIFTVALDSRLHRTGDIWHVWLSGLPAGTCYAYRVDGPYRPEQGLRFNRRRVLIDPYARAIAPPPAWDFNRAKGHDPASAIDDGPNGGEDNGFWAAKGLLPAREINPLLDHAPRHPWSSTVIYETHVRGLTVDPSSKVAHPGTYRGVVEKIPYLKELGVTSIELLPVQEFNERGNSRVDPLTGRQLVDYWGYNPVGFFAPKASYAAGGAGAQVGEFREMVRKLHGAGLEVVLDVTFNHTAEGDESGPTFSWRGLDNPVYYLLDDDPRRYRNYSGCGNTLNCNHPVVRDLILDCLRYWAIEMGIDGFRFDLASILGRDREGRVIANPPLLEAIAEDPILRSLKLIAEPWDLGGAYQLGSFPAQRWAEWNGRYRDEVRRFWRGDPAMAGAMASRLCGSADIYQHHGKPPLNSINFITCHDGLTLHDLVSYARKHNDANGEDNRDGAGDDYSCNYGVEGDSGDPALRAVRMRQMKNLTATLMLSRGVPMILGGDEFGRTQRGNNNAYCQDNEVSWYDWRLLDRNHELFEFTRRMIGFRMRHPVLCAERFYSAGELAWFNPAGAAPDWEANDNTLGCAIRAGAEQGGMMVIMFNAAALDIEFRLPAATAGGKWRMTVNTAAPAPAEIAEPAAAAIVNNAVMHLAPRSLVVLEEDAAAAQSQRSG